MRALTFVLGLLVISAYAPAVATGQDCTAEEQDAQDRCFYFSAVLYHHCMDDVYPDSWCVGGYEARMEECYGMCLVQE